MPLPRKSTTGTRGKYAENKVKEVLEKLALKMGFAYYRIPDAREGAKKEAPADFMTSEREGHYSQLTLVEVKEVAHDYRLPKKNFESAQRARMRMWEAAGAEGWLLILHTNLNKWRKLPLNYFDGDFSESGSWNLEEIPLQTLKECMTEIYGAKVNQ